MSYKSDACCSAGIRQLLRTPLTWPCQRPAADQHRAVAHARHLAAAVQPLLGGCYTFQQPLLLMEALTHVSVVSQPSYQLLEFLGDALVDLVVTLTLLSHQADRWVTPF
jgi:hypothetical protein